MTRYIDITAIRVSSADIRKANSQTIKKSPVVKHDLIINAIIVQVYVSAI